MKLLIGLWRATHLIPAFFYLRPRRTVTFPGNGCKILSISAARRFTTQAVLIARLDSPRGGQRYRIPDTIDLSQYPTLLLHCEQYSKLWGGATIR